jgi:hypothetical protein
MVWFDGSRQLEQQMEPKTLTRNKEQVKGGKQKEANENPCMPSIIQAFLTMSFLKLVGTVSPLIKSGTSLQF